MNCTVTSPEANPFTAGELLCMFVGAASCIFELPGIDTFDQPGMEKGKKTTCALLDTPGFEEKRAEFAARPADNAAYIL